jgi:hypothetical protein
MSACVIEVKGNVKLPAVTPFYDFADFCWNTECYAYFGN